MRTRTVVVASAAVRLVAALVVDRGIAWAAARSISDGVTGSRCASGPVSTDVHGFPLLTQLARGRLDRVTVTLADVDTQGVPVESVVLDLYDVSTDPQRVASRAELMATVPAAGLQQLAGNRWDVAVEDGALVVTGIGAGSSPVQFHLVPRLMHETLHFDVRDVLLFGTPVGADQVPSELVDEVDRLDRDLRTLPLALDPVAVDVEDAGLVVRAAGDDVDVGGTC